MFDTTAGQGTSRQPLLGPRVQQPHPRALSDGDAADRAGSSSLYLRPLRLPEDAAPVFADIPDPGLGAALRGGASSTAGSTGLAPVAGHARPARLNERRGSDGWAEGSSGAAKRTRSQRQSFLERKADAEEDGPSTDDGTSYHQLHDGLTPPQAAVSKAGDVAGAVGQLHSSPSPRGFNEGVSVPAPLSASAGRGGAGSDAASRKQVMLQEDEVLDEDGITTTDFLRGRVVFSNSAWYDWRLYLKNHHPLLALFCAHKRHPYGKCTRLMVLISALCFSFAMSTLVTLKLGCNQCLASTCTECFADLTTIQTGHIDISPFSVWVGAATRWYVRGPCQWCGNQTYFAGGCWNPIELDTLISGESSFCPEVDLQYFVTPACAAALPQPAHPSVLSPHTCAARDRTIVLASATIIAFIVWCYEYMLRSCGHCKCAYRFISAEIMQRAPQQQKLIDDDSTEKSLVQSARCCCSCTAGQCIFHCCRSLAGVTITCAVLCGLVYVTAGIAFIFAAHRDYLSALQAFFVSKTASWAMSLVFCTVFFALKRWIQLRRYRQRAAEDAREPLLARSTVYMGLDMDDDSAQDGHTSARPLGGWGDRSGYGSDADSRHSKPHGLSPATSYGAVSGMQTARPVSLFGASSSSPLPAQRAVPAQDTIVTQQSRGSVSFVPVHVDTRRLSEVLPHLRRAPEQGAGAPDDAVSLQQSLSGVVTADSDDTVNIAEAEPDTDSTVLQPDQTALAGQP